MQTQGKIGMQTMEAALLELVTQNVISLAEARERGLVSDPPPAGSEDVPLLRARR
jgi:hypothetical protein